MADRQRDQAPLEQPAETLSGDEQPPPAAEPEFRPADATPFESPDMDAFYGSESPVIRRTGEE